MLWAEGEATGTRWGAVLGRGTSQLLSVGGSPVALLGCTEADMDFWCWRGRAAETAAEAEAVEARDPGMVRLSLPFWMEAWPRLALSRSGEFLLRFVLVERTLFVEGVGVVFFLSRPGRGLAGTLAVLLAFRPDSRSSSGRLFSALLL